MGNNNQPIFGTTRVKYSITENPRAFSDTWEVGENNRGA
jgi:hypothetical protein